MTITGTVAFILLISLVLSPLFDSIAMISSFQLNSCSQFQHQQHTLLMCNANKQDRIANKNKNETKYDDVSMVKRHRGDAASDKNKINNDDDDDRITNQRRRRLVLEALTVGSWTLLPSSGRAGEVGAQITKAVTTSDLGIAVRVSVVKGAQLMDRIDSSWEKFSDTYGLGSERRGRETSERAKRGRRIPDRLPLDLDAAQQVLDISDDAFLSLSPGSTRKTLMTRIQKITKASKASFQRSGVDFSSPSSSSGDYDTFSDVERFQTASQFNFVLYTHFKAYSESLLEKGNHIEFLKFQREFEHIVGQRLIDVWKLQDNSNSNLNLDLDRSIAIATTTAASTTTTTIVSVQDSRQKNDDALLKNKILNALAQTDSLGRRLRELGLISIMDRNSIEITEDIEDFVDDALADLVINVAIDDDITLQSQILLQEQGYRLYPNFNRFIVAELFRQQIETNNDQQRDSGGAISGTTHKVSVIDYYFDTSYNSDPDKFEVKEVLLNISIE